MGLHGSKPGERRGGRQKGTPNKVTGELRAMVMAALSKAGGVGYLTEQAHESPNAFLSLLGKVLPLQVTGKDGESLIPPGGVVFVVREQDGAVNRT